MTPSSEIPARLASPCDPFPQAPIRDLVHFRQFFLLERKGRAVVTEGKGEKGGKKSGKLSRDRQRVARIAVPVLRRIQARSRRSEGDGEEVREPVEPEVRTECRTAEAKRSAVAPKQSVQLLKMAINDPILSVIEAVAGLGDQSVASRPLTPRFALGVDYEQSWIGEGYARGRLLRSVPVSAGGSVDVTVKSWRKRTERRENVESIERDITNEIVQDEKWSRAVTKTVSNTMNGGVNGQLNGKANVSVPVKGATVGGEAGGQGGGNLDNSLTTSISDTEERISQVTAKSIDQLKSVLSSTVEVTGESGFETESRQTLTNPNRCNTLNYHFYEVVERLRIETSAKELGLYVLVPLELPALTKEWLLCHECELRRLLPCESLYAGFEAAKLLTRQEHLGRFTGALDDASATAAADSVRGVLRKVAEIYELFVGAVFLPSPPRLATRVSLLTLPPPPTLEEIGEAVEKGKDEVVKAGEKVVEKGKEVVENAQEFVEEELLPGGEDEDDTAVEQLGAAIGETTETAVNTLIEGAVLGGEAVIETLTGVVEAGTELGLDIIDSVTEAWLGGEDGEQGLGTGGPGSFLYWQVVVHVAPELAGALGSLYGTWEAIEALPEGPERNRLSIDAARTFFTEVGDVDAAFAKIDIVLGALAAGGVAAVAGLGAVAAAPVAAPAAGLGATVVAVGVPLAMAGAAAVSGAAVALSGVIAAALDQFGLDVFPTDNGLRTQISRLRGVATYAASVTAMPPIPSANADEDQLAAYRAAQAAAQAEQDRVADARIEYERLLCHIKDNLLYYAQSHWSRMSSDEIAGAAAKHGLGAAVVDTSFSGFVGHFGALRVLDHGAVEEALGFDFDAERRRLKLDEFAENGERLDSVQVPTPGVVVEGNLGECSVCDEFVGAHRDLDLEHRRQEVAEKKALAEQSRLEAERLRLRIERGELDDPTPFEGGGATRVHVDGEDD